MMVVVEDHRKRRIIRRERNLGMNDLKRGMSTRVDSVSTLLDDLDFFLEMGIAIFGCCLLHCLFLGRFACGFSSEGLGFNFFLSNGFGFETCNHVLDMGAR